MTSSIRPGVVNLTPNADTIQEASVQTNTYTVDYGRASSIQTIMTTRSGTDQYHGFASEFYTYQGLFARGEFGVPSGTAVSPYHTNNLWFGVGGSVIPKHQFFFFAGYEPYRAITSTGASLQTFEDPAFTAFANSVMPKSPEVTLLNKYEPTGATFRNVLQNATQAFGAQNLANNTGCGTPSTDNIPCGTPVFDQGNLNSSSYNNSNQYNVRLDKDFKKDRVYGLFYRNTINTGGPAVRPGFAETDKYYTFSVQGNETHTFSPTTLNEGFIGYNRIEGFAPSGGNFTVPVVNVTGLGVGFGDGFALGDYIQHSYHWRDVLTHIRAPMISASATRAGMGTMSRISRPPLRSPPYSSATSSTSLIMTPTPRQGSPTTLSPACPKPITMPTSRRPAAPLQRTPGRLVAKQPSTTEYAMTTLATPILRTEPCRPTSTSVPVRAFPNR